MHNVNNKPVWKLVWKTVAKNEWSDFLISYLFIFDYFHYVTSLDLGFACFVKRGFCSLPAREICADPESWNCSTFIYCTFSDQERVEFDTFWRHHVSFCRRTLEKGEWKPRLTPAKLEVRVSFLVSTSLVFTNGFSNRFEKGLLFTLCIHTHCKVCCFK